MFVKIKLLGVEAFMKNPFVCRVTFFFLVEVEILVILGYLSSYLLWKH